MTDSNALQLNLFGFSERIVVTPGGTIRAHRHQMVGQQSRRRKPCAGAVQLEFDFGLTFAADPVAHNAADVVDDAAYRRLHFGYSRDQ
jgi:hypothetical protein